MIIWLKGKINDKYLIRNVKEKISFGMLVYLTIGKHL